MDSTATSKNEVYLEPKKGQLSKGDIGHVFQNAVDGQKLLNQIVKHLFFTWYQLLHDVSII